MKKSIFALPGCVLLLGATLSVSAAGDSSKDIIKIESDIAEAGSTNIDYEDELVIDFDTVKSAASAADDAYRSSVDDDILSVKTPKRSVCINIDNAPEEVSFSLDKSLTKCKGSVDELVIKAGDMCFYLDTEELSDSSFDNGSTLVSVTDTNGTLDRFAGKGGAVKVRRIAIILFSVIAVYAFILLLVALLRKISVGKKVFISLFSFMFFVLGIGGCYVACTEQLSFFYNYQSESFDVSDPYANGIGISVKPAQCPISIGIPVYANGIDENIGTVYLKDANGGEATNLAGRYIEDNKVFKCKYKGDGEYYLANNVKSFDDISSSSGNEELYTAVSVLAAKGIVSGKSGTDDFGKDDTITRAELATIMCNLLDLQQTSSSSSTFKDLESGKWYVPYVNACYDNGIIKGQEIKDEDDKTIGMNFMPDDNITHVQSASIFASVLSEKAGYVYPEEPDLMQRYDDFEDIKGWAWPCTELLEQQGINVWSNEYRPDDPLTRGEAAMMIYRMYMKLY
jgi:hypothetical protein